MHIRDVWGQLLQSWGSVGGLSASALRRYGSHLTTAPSHSVRDARWSPEPQARWFRGPRLDCPPDQPTPPGQAPPTRQPSAEEAPPTAVLPRLLPGDSTSKTLAASPMGFYFILRLALIMGRVKRPLRDDQESPDFSHLADSSGEMSFEEKRLDFLIHYFHSVASAPNDCARRWQGPQLWDCTGQRLQE